MQLTLILRTSKKDTFGGNRKAGEMVDQVCCASRGLC
jgi:hypothetical protein